MNTTPTPEELRSLAAKLDPKLSPDEAVERAHALWAAVDKALPPTQIADEEEKEEERKLRVKAEILERVGLNLCDDEGISLSEAFKMQQDIASRVGVSPYKTEKRFVAALSKAGLTADRDISGEWLTPGFSTFRDWHKVEESNTPRPGRETQELTSKRAIKELFDQRVEQRIKRDRERKAALQKTKSQKNVAESKGQKAERKPLKAEPKNKKAEATKQKAERSEST